MTIADLDLATTSAVPLSTNTTMRALVYHGPGKRARRWFRAISAFGGYSTQMGGPTGRSWLSYLELLRDTVSTGCSCAP